MNPRVVEVSLLRLIHTRSIMSGLPTKPRPGTYNPAGSAVKTQSPSCYDQNKVDVTLQRVCEELVQLSNPRGHAQINSAPSNVNNQSSDDIWVHL
jgi:hypothetical protein